LRWPTRSDTFFEQKRRFVDHCEQCAIPNLFKAKPARHNTLTDEAKRIARQHRQLAKSPGEHKSRRKRLRRRFGTAHDFQQAHHVRGTEKMQPDDITRPLCGSGDAIEIKIRRIRGKQCAGTRQLIDALKHLLLDREIFEHRFYQGVDVC
jgi:Na+-translocating ferredoxin:NAD+ oxidoreductase RnfC subunit